MTPSITLAADTSSYLTIVQAPSNPRTHRKILFARFVVCLTCRVPPAASYSRSWNARRVLGWIRTYFLPVLSRKWINIRWDVDSSVNFMVTLVPSNLAKTLIPSLTSLSTCRGASGALQPPNDRDFECIHFFLQMQAAMSIKNENHHLRSHLFLPSRSTAIIRFPRRDIAFLVLLFQAVQLCCFQR